MSSSPLVINGVVVVQIQCQGDSFAAGLDAESGELIWRVERPRKPNWNSPAPLTMANGVKVVVLTSSADVLGIDPRSGKEVFRYAKGGGSIPSTLGWQGKLLVAANGLTALECNTSDGEPQKLWDNNKLDRAIPRRSWWEMRVVLVKGGVLTVGDARNGELLYKLRLPTPVRSMRLPSRVETESMSSRTRGAALSSR